MKLNLKFDATGVAEIERIRDLPIENCVADTKVDSLCLFLQKGLVDDNGIHGVSKTVAISKLDEFLKENGKDELILCFVEALVESGFLPKEMSPEKMRKALKQKTELIQKLMDEI